MKTLEELRKEKELTRLELAWRLKTSEALIWRWERGKTLPSFPYAVKLAEVLGVSLEELYEVLTNQKGEGN